MEQTRRKDPYLNEAIGILNVYFEQANADAKVAYEKLSPGWRTFIDEEISRCAEPIYGLRYFLENYHTIQSEHEGLYTLHTFWDSQEIFFEAVIRLMLAGRKVKIIVLKARQLGLSTITEGIIFWKTIFTETCNSIVVAQDPDQADYLFGMSRLSYDSLPWWMRPEARYEAKGRYLYFDKRDPVERMMNPGLKSQILVQAANKATGVGVGKTIRAAHLSELSAWSNPETLTTQLFPSMNAPDTIAILESTARGRKGFWYSLWEDAWNGNVDWEPVFIESFRVRKYATVITPGENFTLTKEEDAIRAKVEREKSIRISDEHFKWRREKIAEVVAIQGDEWKFYEQYPSVTWMEAFQGSGICAFNKRKLHLLLETTTKQPVWVGEVRLAEDNKTPKLRGHHIKEGERVTEPCMEGTRLLVWELPEEGESYYIGADVAHGVQGGNFSCAQIIKIGRGMQPDVQVAEWRGWINPTPYAYVLCALGYLYNESQICVECNDVGLSTNNTLFRVLEYENVYRWKQFDKVKNFHTDFFGWYTNSKTRDQIIAKLREGIDEDSILLQSEWLLNEMLDFASDDADSRFEGQEGDDDRVLAMMIAYFCAHDSDWGKQAAMTDKKKQPRDASGKFIPEGMWNRDWSPIYDKPGIRQDMFFDRDVPAELIMYSDITSEPRGDEDELWKNY